MKSKFVDTITSNEGHVRLQIFEGRLPIDQAAEEMIRIAEAQRDHAFFVRDEAIGRAFWAEQLLALHGVTAKPN